LSEFMRNAARRDPAVLAGLFETPLADRLEAIMDEIARSPYGDEASESAIMKALRRLKGEAHFLIALGSLSGEADTALTVERLSRLADACIGAAVDFLLRDAHRQGKLKLPDANEPARGSGLVVLA